MDLAVHDTVNRLGGGAPYVRPEFLGPGEPAATRDRSTGPTARVVTSVAIVHPVSRCLTDAV